MGWWPQPTALLVGGLDFTEKVSPAFEPRRFSREILRWLIVLCTYYAPNENLLRIKTGLPETPARLSISA